MTIFEQLEAMEDHLQHVLVDLPPTTRTEALSVARSAIRELLTSAIQEGSDLLAAKGLRLYALASVFLNGWDTDAGRHAARIRRATRIFSAGRWSTQGETQAWVTMELGKACAIRGAILQHWFDSRSSRGVTGASRCFEHAAMVFDSLGQTVDACRQRVNAGDCAFNLGRLGDPAAFEAAGQLWGRALRESGTRVAEAERAQWMVKYASAMGERASGERRNLDSEARAAFEEALVEADLSEDPAARVMIRLNYGGLLHQSRGGGWRDDVRRAIVLLEDAHDLAQGVPEFLPSIALSLSAAWLTVPSGALVPNIEKAIEYGHMALKAFEAHNEPVEIARCQHNLAEAYAMRIAGDRTVNLAMARSLIRGALHAVPRRYSRALWSQLQFAAGRIEMFHAGPATEAGWRRAARHMRLARATARLSGPSGLEDLALANVLLALHRSSHDPRDLIESLACARRAIRNAIGAEDTEVRRRALVAEGCGLVEEGNWEAAAVRYDEAIALLSGAPVTRERESFAQLARAMGAGTDVYGLAAYAHAVCGRPQIGFERLLNGKCLALRALLTPDAPSDLSLDWLAPGTVWVAPLFDVHGCRVFIAGHTANGLSVEVLEINSINAGDLTAMLFGGKYQEPAWADHLEARESATLVACIESASTWLYTHFTGPIHSALKRLFDPAHVRIIFIPHAGSGALPWHSAGASDSLAAHWRLSYSPAIAAPGFARVTDAAVPVKIVAVSDPTGHLKAAPLEVDAILALRRDADGSRFGPGTATVDALAAACETADYIHFACHAEFDPYDPRLARLCLADGAGLSVETISSRFQLAKRPVVTLAGCETGIADFADRGEEVIGLASAWIAAGARCVIGALWQVADLPSTLLFLRFYQLVFGGHFPDVALASAAAYLQTLERGEADAICQAYGHNRRQIEEAAKISGSERYPFRHELFWGGFILMESPADVKMLPAR